MHTRYGPTAILPGATAHRDFTGRALPAETYVADAPATMAALGVHDEPGTLGMSMIWSLAERPTPRIVTIVVPALGIWVGTRDDAESVATTGASQRRRRRRHW